MVPTIILLQAATHGESVAADPDTFGYQPGGSPSNWQSVGDRITGSWDSPDSDGTVTSITAYVDDPDGPIHYQFELYKKSDNSLVGYTSESYFTGEQGGGWMTIDIDSGGDINAGVDYYLAVWGEEPTCAVGYETEGNKGAYDDETYDGSLPNPWSPTVEDKKCWIYATYTPNLVYPTEPQPYFPENESTIYDNTPYFVWTIGENADNHYLIIDNDSNCQSPIDNVFFTEDNDNWQKGGSPYDLGTYYWRVISKNENGENTSGIFTFTIDEWEFTPDWTYSFDDDNKWEGEACAWKDEDGGAVFPKSAVPEDELGITWEEIDDPPIAFSDDSHENVGAPGNWRLFLARFEILEDNIQAIEIRFEGNSASEILCYILDNYRGTWILMDNKVASTDENFWWGTSTNTSKYIDNNDRLWIAVGSKAQLCVDYVSCSITGGIDNRAPITTLIYAGTDNKNWVHNVRMPDDFIEVKVKVYDHSTIDNVFLEFYDNGVWDNIQMNDDVSVIIDGVSYYYFENKLDLENERQYSFNVLALDNEGLESKLEWLRMDNTGAYVRRYFVADCAITDNLQYAQFYIWEAHYDTINSYLDHEQKTNGSVNDTGYLQKEMPTSLQERYCGAFLGFWMNENMTISPTVIENIYIHIWWATDDNVGRMAYGKFENTIMMGGITNDYTIEVEDAVAGPSVHTGVQPNHYLEARFWDVDDLVYDSNDIFQFQIGDSTVDLDNPDWVDNRNYSSYVIINVPSDEVLQTMDSDGDELNDYQELYVWFTNPFVADTDNDGIQDNEDPNPLNTLKEVRVDGVQVENIENIIVTRVDPNTQFRLRVKVFGISGLENIENLTVKIYESSLGQDDLDAIENHYTFVWTREDGFVENEYLVIDNCFAGDDELYQDFYTFAVVLSENVVGGLWDVWAEVYDNSGHYDNSEFLSDFRVSAWYLLETWSNSVKALVGWQMIETWTGGLDTQVAWQSIENWIGTIEAFADWDLITTWAGTVEAFADWDLIETWSGGVLAYAGWSEIETWTGTIHAVGWKLVETWIGTVQNPSAVVTTESATDVGMTIATLNALVSYGSYPSVDIRFQYRVLGAGTWTNTDWENDYTATVYSKDMTGLSPDTTYQFKGHIQFGAFENYGSIVEFTTQAEAPPTQQWYLTETWTGAIQTADVVRWREAESWGGTITATAQEEEPPSGPGPSPEPEPEPEPEPVPTTIPLEVAGAWALLLTVCVIWVSSIPHGPRRRKWGNDIARWIIPTMTLLTLLYIYSEKIVLSAITKLAGAWLVILAITGIYLMSMEPGHRRLRWARQFLKTVLPTLIVLSLVYARIEGLI